VDDADDVCGLCWGATMSFLFTLTILITCFVECNYRLYAIREEREASSSSCLGLTFHGGEGWWGSSKLLYFSTWGYLKTKT
jgi:hypothetical protein